MLKFGSSSTKILTTFSLVLGLLVVTPPSANAAACTGSDFTSSAGAATREVVLKFISTTECAFTIPTYLTSITILAVGAGGGGGGDGGSGGGGGELRYGAVNISGGTVLNIRAGVGGAGGPWGGSSGSGTSSTVTGAATFTANGGGGGAGWTSSVGASGGSGGTGGTGTNGQQGGGGPGGACYPIGYGSTAPGSTPSNSITGSTVYYGGGGGGGFGAQTNNGGSGFLGALGGTNSGGRGANYKISIADDLTAVNGATNGHPGVANTGGGGGGGSACNAYGNMAAGIDGVYQRTAGGAGANGVVIVSYIVPALTTPSTPDLVSASDLGSSDTDNTTNDTTPTFTGTAEPKSQVQLQLAGVNTGSPCTTNALGIWECTAGVTTYNNAAVFRVTSTFDSITYTTSSTLTIVVWPTGTAASISRTDTGATTLVQNQTANIRVDTGRGIYDFAIEDFTVTGGSLSNFVIVNNRAFTAVFTPASNASGTATITIGANKFFDIAGNNNSASTPLSIAYNTVGPSAPTSLVATPGNGQVSIAFTEGATNGSAITNYKYSLDGTNFTAFSPIDATSPVVITGLTNGAAYTIYLKAVNAIGDSLPSTSVAVTPATNPSAPTSLVASPGNGQLTITFTEGAAGGSAITNYKYSIDGSTFTALSPVDASSPVTIPSLTNGTSYTVYLKAVNAVGESVSSALVTATPNVVPTASTAPVVSGTVRQGQTLSVTNGTWANSPTSYSYSWSRAATSGGTYTTISGAILNSYTLGAADVGNFIKASVVATNSAGDSATSTSAATASAVTATCSPLSSTVDSAYTVLSFTSVGTCFWNVPVGVTTADVLVVGGGGGGAGTYSTGTGGSGGGGGGGGAYLANAVPLTPTQLLQLVIGAGGNGGITTSSRPGSEGAPGGDSAFTTLTAGGGGGGGCATTTSNNVVCTNSNMSGRAGTAGGSGGGATPPWNAYNWGAAGVGSSVTIGGTTFASQTGYIGAIYNGGAGSGGGARGAATTSAVGAGLSSTIAGGNAVEYGRGGRGSNQSGTTFNATTSGYGNGGDGAVVAADPGAPGAAGAQGIIVVKYVSTYTVTYSYNSADGGNSSTTATFTPGGTAITLPTPTRTGYVFKGWYTASTGGSLVGDAGTSYTPTGTTAAITIQAQWNSTDATLSALALTAGTLSPTFNKDVLSYTASVKNSITSITITPTKGDSNATVVQYLGASGTTAFTGSVSVGANVIRTIVTAQDGSQKIYTVTVTRATTISFINTLTAPTGVAMVAYQGVTFTAATGGSGSFTYTYSINNVVNAALPAGLVFSGANRSITGTPTVAATTGTIRIIATDTNSDVYTMTTGFTITISSSSQLPISIVTRYGSGGSNLFLGVQGGSGSGALTYTLDPNPQTSCQLSGSVLTPSFATGASGSCYVKVTKAADAAYTEVSSSRTAIFFTAYVPVVTQSFTCPAGTVPSNPSGIGVGSCMQVLAPVSTASGDAGAAPKITALSIFTGLVNASVIITGTGFSSATKVQFGSKSTTTFTKTSTTITVNVPTGATTGRVMVFSPTGTAMAAQIFTVISPDTRAPSYQSGNVNTSTPTQINLNFDESLASSGILSGAFGVSVDGLTRGVSSVSISGSTITLTLASAISTGQAVLFTYTSPGDSTSIQDAIGNKTGTIVATAVSNTL